MLHHHLTQFLLPLGLQKQINRCIFRFAWNGPDRIKREIAGRPWKAGGINIQPIDTINQVALLTWIRNYKDQDEAWAQALKRDYKAIGGIGALSRKGKLYSKAPILPEIRAIFEAFRHLHEPQQADEMVWGNSKISKKPWYKSRL